MIKFDRTAFRRFVQIAKPFFVSEQRWKARGLLVLLATFSITVSLLNVRMSYIGRDFMTALTLKDKDEFVSQLWWYLVAFAIATPVVVFYRYTEERLGLLWRQWLSLRLLRSYLTNRAYYKINILGLIDNPDQRIEEDIRTFTTLSLSFLLIIFNSIIQLFAFMGILWSISTTLTFAAIGYATLGSLVTYFLGRPLIGLNFSQLKKEADYRYKLINVRDNAESIAFYRGEKKESTRARQRLHKALENLKLIINWNRNLGFFTTGYNYVVTILPTIIVAPLYLDGKIEIGVVTQAGFAFAQVLGALSIIVLNFGGLSAFGAVISRLGSFWEVLEEIETDSPQTGIQVVEGGLAFHHVTVLTPRRHEVVLSDLTFSVPSGSGLLISGPSGSGKSTVLRALAGLWTSGSGRVERPPLDDALFLPQRPYMVLGTLRSQLLYAQQTSAFTDAMLMDVMRLVELHGMVKRVGGFDAELDWPNILSTGEQQRLAFARLFLRRPSYAFLDEATTALDQRSEEHLYSLLAKTVKGYVSVGHRVGLARFHRVVLELHGEGEWSLETVDVNGANE
jgi:vitamin B12/bleomycin/antimicrobial peptide transport system ATP-binding/permease protein